METFLAIVGTIASLVSALVAVLSLRLNRDPNAAASPRLDDQRSLQNVFPVDVSSEHDDKVARATTFLKTQDRSFRTKHLSTLVASQAVCLIYCGCVVAGLASGWPSLKQCVVIGLPILIVIVGALIAAFRWMIQERYRLLVNNLNSMQLNSNELLQVYEFSVEHEYLTSDRLPDEVLAIMMKTSISH